jgi:hypothetical protein
MSPTTSDKLSSRSGNRRRAGSGRLAAEQGSVEVMSLQILRHAPRNVVVYFSAAPQRTLRTFKLLCECHNLAKHDRSNSARLIRLPRLEPRPTWMFPR